VPLHPLLQGGAYSTPTGQNQTTEKLHRRVRKVKTQMPKVTTLGKQNSADRSQNENSVALVQLVWLVELVLLINLMAKVASPQSKNADAKNSKQ
jgi:hypothetical protein